MAWPRDLRPAEWGDGVAKCLASGCKGSVLAQAALYILPYVFQVFFLRQNVIGLIFPIQIGLHFVIIALYVLNFPIICVMLWILETSITYPMLSYHTLYKVWDERRNWNSNQDKELLLPVDGSTVFKVLIVTIIFSSCCLRIFLIGKFLVKYCSQANAEDSDASVAPITTHISGWEYSQRPPTAPPQYESPPKYEDIFKNPAQI